MTDLQDLGLDATQVTQVNHYIKEMLKDKYIPISRFNEVYEEKAELKKQLIEMNEKLESMDHVNKKYETLKEKYKEMDLQHQQRYKSLEIDVKLQDKLSKETTKSSLLKKLLDITKLDIKDGELVGLDEQLEKLKNDEDTQFLFKTSSTLVSETPKGQPNGKEFITSEKKDSSKVTLSDAVQYYVSNYKII